MEEQAEGVTQNIVDSLGDASDSTPESIENGDSQESEVVDSAEVVSSEAPKSKEYNFKQMRENLNRFETEKKQWEAERQQLMGAKQLDEVLRKDPITGLKFLAKSLGVDPKKLIDEVVERQAQETSDLPKIDFEQYDPETAKLLKFMHDRASKVDQLEQWKNKFEQTIEQSQQEARESQIQQNMASIDSEFDNQLIKDGFMDKDGNGSAELIDVIRDAIISRLTKISGDARLATKEQFHEAYKAVSSGLSAHQKQTLKKTVKTDVPLSGSRKGGIPIGKAKMTEDERIGDIVNSLGG